MTNFKARASLGLALFMVSGLAAAPLVAQPRSEGRAATLQRLTQCRQETDDTRRLACYDAAVASVSHLPHLLAVLMASYLHGVPDDHLRLAGPGLRDVTRVAGGDPELWEQILGANRSAVLSGLWTLREELAGVITAIVMISAAVDQIPEVAQRIADLEGVSEVYSVTGAIDLIVLVRVSGHEQVAEVVADRLNKVLGVRETETHIAFRAYSSHDLEAAFAIGAD